MEKECLAVVWAITKQFHCFLYGGQFLLRNDNQPLSWLKSLKHPPMRVARGILKLQEFTFEIQHRPGIRHQNADALSRLPINMIELSSPEGVAKLREDQLEDVGTGPVLRALELPRMHTTFGSSGENLSKEARFLLKQIDILFVRDGILQRRWRPDGDLTPIEQTIVPS